ETLSDLVGKTEPPWGLKHIGIEKLRKEFPTITGKNIRVGIIDTGIQSRHPELKDKLEVFKDFINRMELPYDDHGHGTHVAGTIAGNEVGLAPGSRLIVAKGLAGDGSATDADLLSAMQWMFDPDGDPKTPDQPQVVSNS